MQNQDQLQNLRPNRYYSINANLKYLHETQKRFTCIIQQNNSQSKLSIKNKDVQLSEGWDYKFGKCFKSKNGWIYANNPLMTIQKQNEVQIQQPLTLSKVFQLRKQLTNHYISLYLFVVQVLPLIIVKNKSGKEVKLNKMICFGDGLLIDVIWWQKQIDSLFVNKWVSLQGFRVNYDSQETMVLNSSVYSKLLVIEGQNIYSPTITYKNLSSYFKPRKILDLLSLAQYQSKLYSQINATIVELKLSNYNGCIICQRKIQGVQCDKCGGDVIPNNFTLLKAKITDNDSQIYATVFNPQLQKILIEITQNSPTSLVTIRIKTTKSNDTLYLSHIISSIALIK